MFCLAAALLAAPAGQVVNILPDACVDSRTGLKSASPKTRTATPFRTSSQAAIPTESILHVARHILACARSIQVRRRSSRATPLFVRWQLEFAKPMAICVVVCSVATNAIST